MSRLELTIRIVLGTILFGVIIPALISSKNTLLVLLGISGIIYAFVSLGYNVSLFIKKYYNEGEKK